MAYKASICAGAFGVYCRNQTVKKCRLIHGEGRKTVMRYYCKTCYQKIKQAEKEEAKHG